MKVLYFTTSYCGPCKIMSPIIEQLAREYYGQIEFIKVEIEKQPDMQAFYRINTVPTMIILDREVEKSRIVGGLNKNQIIKWLGSIK